MHSSLITYLSHLSDKQSKNLKWGLGKGFAYSQDSNSEQLLKSLIPPVNCGCLCILLAGLGVDLWTAPRVGCQRWAGLRHKARPVGGSSSGDGWGLRLMSLQGQHFHFIRFRFWYLFQEECRLLQPGLIKMNCTHPLSWCREWAKLTQL